MMSMKENFKHEIIGDEQSHSFKFNNLEPFTDSESDSESETEEESMEPVHFLPEGRKRQEEQEKSLRKPNNKEKSAKKTQSISDFKPSQLLLKAARRGRLDLVTYVLDMDGSLIDACDGDGYTALHRASYEGHEDVVRTLLLRGADVSALTLDGWQPLHCACRWGQTDIASLLLQNSADINAQTNGKLTPLHLAATGAEGTSILELLLCNRRLDASLRNSGGDTAFDIAKRSGRHCKLFELVEESINFKY